MKKILAILVISMLLLCACGDGGSSVKPTGASDAAAEDAKAAFSSMIDAFKEKKYDEALTFVQDEDAEKFDFSNSSQSAFYGVMFEHMSATVENAQFNEDGTVTLSVTLSAPDMLPIFGEIFTRYVDSSMASSESGGSDWRANNEKILIEMASAKDAAVKSTALDVSVVSDGGEWKVVFTNELMDAMLGGISEASKTISDALEEGVSIKNGN